MYNPLSTAGGSDQVISSLWGGKCRTRGIFQLFSSSVIHIKYQYVTGYYYISYNRRIRGSGPMGQKNLIKSQNIIRRIEIWVGTYFSS